MENNNLSDYIRDYYLTRHGQNIYSDRRGFVIWQSNGEVLQIDEFYLSREHRRGFEIKRFVDDFIRDCRTSEIELHAYIVKNRDDTEGIKMLHKYYGFVEDTNYNSPISIKNYKELI